MSPDPHEIQAESIRYLLAKNAEKDAEIARLTAELAAARAERDSLAADAQRWAMIRDTIHRLDAVARPGLPMGDDDVEQVVLLVLQRAGRRAPVAPQVVRLHQAWEGTTVCLHCGKPMPWEGMEVCPGAQAELTAARRGPVVEWRQMLDGRTAAITTWASDMGGFQLRVAEKNWRTRSFPGWRGEKPGWAVVFGGQSIAASGPETGPAGKAACEAAYRRAAGLA